MKRNLTFGFGIVAIGGVVVCGGAGALILFVFMGIFTLTQPLVDEADSFLGMLGRGKTAEAYASTGIGLRGQQDEASFAAAVKQIGLDDFSSASWHCRQIKNSDGLVEGTVTTKSGVSTSISVRLVREGGAWKIDGVRYGGVDLDTIKVLPPVPDEPELRRLAGESLQGLNQAIRDGDFTEFHGRTSDRLKRATTPKKMRAAFRKFIDNDVDFGLVKNLEPAFAPAPAVDDQGLLTVTGSYPLPTSPLEFTLKYIREPAGWKLYSIDVAVN